MSGTSPGNRPRVRQFEVPGPKLKFHRPIRNHLFRGFASAESLSFRSKLVAEVLLWFRFTKRQNERYLCATVVYRSSQENCLYELESFAVFRCSSARASYTN